MFWCPNIHLLPLFIRTLTNDNKTPTPVICNYGYPLESPREHSLNCMCLTLRNSNLASPEWGPGIALFKVSLIILQSEYHCFLQFSLSGGCKSEPLRVLRTWIFWVNSPKEYFNLDYKECPPLSSDFASIPWLSKWWWTAVRKEAEEQSP